MEGFKRSFELTEGNAVSDMRSRVVPDKGRLNREQPVTKALKFSSCKRKSFIGVCVGFFFFFLSFSSEPEGRVRDGEYTEKQDGGYGVRVTSKI